MGAIAAAAAAVARRLSGGGIARALPTIGGGVAGGALVEQLLPGRTGLDPFNIFGGFGGGSRGGRRRPRRRKALTAEDMRIMLTIASAISKKAAETFIAQRTRSA